MSSPLTKIRAGDATASTQPRVVALDGTGVDEVFEALASETRRHMLEELYDDPTTPSELATLTDTSLQNVHYHLEKLGDVDLVEPVGTRYSEKGAEMSVYAPTSDPLVVVEGEEDRDEMESRLKRLVGAISTITVGSVLAQFALGSRVTPGDPGGGEMMVMTESVEESASAASPGIFDAIGNVLVEPGAMVLVGGLIALLALEAVYRRRTA
ncbi:MAG: helix-turn-helix domain-containing protein [Halodesulfurarchaeum sp.]|nr:helix-turn-helix domain-containing protein [Halodesulfurarchaeum sp.]